MAENKKTRPLILLTNDDGFYSDGITALFERLQDLGEVFIVAPDRERSATSLALTLHHPLRVKAVQDRVYAVDGTPADCIYLAVQRLLPRQPDLIISGLNAGPNLGQQDISYSGTVAGAFQGTFLQIPSLAVSLYPDEKKRFHFDFAAGFARAAAGRLLKNPFLRGTTLNINIPAPPLKGIKIAKLGEKRYHPEIVVKKDPRRRLYYWIGTGTPKAIGNAGSDVKLIKQGYATITPLQRDLTDQRALKDADLTAFVSQVKHEIVS